MEDYFQQLVRSWRSVTSRTVREAVAVLLLLIVVFGSGFSALTTYAEVVIFDEDRFVEELAGSLTMRTSTRWWRPRSSPPPWKWPTCR